MKNMMNSPNEPTSYKIEWPNQFYFPQKDDVKVRR